MVFWWALGWSLFKGIQHACFLTNGRHYFLAPGMTDMMIPDTVFHTRVRDAKVAGPNPFRWQLVQGRDLFAGRRVVVFGLPGAFTPTCSTSQCPDFEKLYPKLVGKATGVDEVYCTSVNDAFVMFQWARSMGVENVKMLPDGNGDFARGMGMLVDKSNLGFGPRSWRYAMVVDDMRVEAMFAEDGCMDNRPDDPFVASTAQNVLRYLTKTSAKAKSGSGKKSKKMTA